ncbi:MAG: Peptidase family [Firmicutes bacterium]|nr:Peptidase family [Bacillota bacterium]
MLPHSFGRLILESLKRKLGSKKTGRSGKREYTFMVVPHQGAKVVSVRVPVKLVKYTTAAVCSALIIVLLMTTGTILNYRHEINVVNTDREELENLREINATQKSQIEVLANATSGLQADMTRLNKLDADLRRLVNSTDLPASRSGVVRQVHDGQGGPAVKPQLSQLTKLVEDLEAQAKEREQSLSAIKAALLNRNARQAVTPSIWPVSGGEVTSRYGWRESPWGGTGGDWHPGIDIANDYGTPIVATADGVVVHSGWYNGYGILVIIDHGNGIETLYGHCSQTIVRVGQPVNKGAVISYMGSTGYSTGNHVHYEVRVNGTAVNPASFL